MTDPSASDGGKPSLSVVIPAFNESARLPGTMDRIAGYLPGSPFDEAEVIVVDDGSADGTAAAAASKAAPCRAAGISLTVLRNARNRGKGFSVRRGMLRARHDWVLLCDADESAPIEEVEKLLAAATAGACPIAIGSRALDRSLIGKRQPAHREWIGRLFNLHVRLVTGLKFRDTQCGFKLFRSAEARALGRRQRLERFGFDVELLYLARKAGCCVVEVPVRWNDAKGSSVRVAQGLAAFAEVWQVRWNDLAGRYRPTAIRQDHPRA